MKTPHIGLVGIALESNAFAPVATETDFRQAFYLEGQNIIDQARTAGSEAPKEMKAFVKTMDITGPWQPVPLLVTACPPWGPIEQGFFEACLEKITGLIAAAEALDGALDGIYVCNHGAMVASGESDPDGTMLAALRAAVGDQVAIIATLDLHGNISQTMTEAADVIIGYRTNPHVDMTPRGEEAAQVMRQMMAGLKPQSAMLRLPLVPPSTTLLTAAGPYADLMDRGQRRALELSDEILNVSVFGNFAFSDCPENGLSVVVTAKSDRAQAQALAAELASHAWGERQRYKREITSIETAVEMARAVAANGNLRANIYSDAGDNPGGGGEGRTAWLLQALVAAEAKHVFYGAFFDPALAAEAHQLGAGAEFTARFNRDWDSEFSKPFEVPATVRALSDGKAVGRLGIYQGQALNLGPCAALQIGGEDGITVVIISARKQAADPVFFEMFGLDIAQARTVCVKSRGHFRAGFTPWFEPEEVYEIDTPGLTSPVLSRFTWKGLPRPVYPMDEETKWSPPDW